MLITTFAAGGATYILSFVSSDVVADDFGVQDRTYIQILAAFFANHLQQRWQAERIQYQQAHDTLTGLLNRSQFRSQARLAALGTKSYSLILVDINAFHEINESYGHMTGDSLLLEVATALRDRVGPTEILGRVGGNTFGIYVPEQLSSEEVTRRARDLGGVFAGGFSTGDREGREFIGLTASLGIATAPEHGDGIDAIFSHADAALLAAKDRGPASIVVFAPGMEGEAQRRAALRSQLTSAVTADQFLLYFQPHVDIETGRVIGAEALIRWQHPERGLLLPGLFIPFAEQTGLITTIDAWVMRNAFVAAKALAEIDPEFRLYFNLSGRQAGDTQIVRAFSEAARNGVSLTNIGIEITESDAMRDVELTRRVCRALRRIGVRIAIDDFGTGYSSLSFLKLPVDIEDRSIRVGVLTDPRRLIAGRHLDYPTLAESLAGEGDVGKSTRLRAGCNVQGFKSTPINRRVKISVAHKTQRLVKRSAGRVRKRTARKVAIVTGADAYGPSVALALALKARAWCERSGRRARRWERCLAGRRNGREDQKRGKASLTTTRSPTTGRRHHQGGHRTFWPPRRAGEQRGNFRWPLPRILRKIGTAWSPFT